MLYVESHDYMAGNQELVIETIEEPDYIIKGSSGELIAARYYEKTSISEKFVIVVYKEVNNNGFVITSFMSSKIEKIIFFALHLRYEIKEKVD